MNNNFLKAYQETNGHEGFWSNHKNDRGGETWKGIARNFHPKWRGWVIIESYKKKVGFPSILSRVSELNVLHQQFFYDEFWKRIKLDAVADIDQNIAMKLYDIGVNMGTSVPSKMLQRALNLTNRNGRDYADIAVDGDIGNASLYALRYNRDKKVLFKVIDNLQGYRYIEIAEKNKTQEDFINGWFANRIR